MLILGATIAAPVMAQEEILTRAFVVKFKKVDEVASVVNGLLGEKGAVTLQPGLRTIIVQDTEKSLRQIEMVIAAFDTPPPSVEITVKLVRATKNSTEPGVSEEIRNMARLGEVLRFNQYTLMDGGVIETQEGQNSVLLLAKDYQLRFFPDVIQEGNGIIRLKDLELRKRIQGKKKDLFTTLISVTVNLRNSETLVLGASRFEDSDQALLVILLGKIKEYQVSKIKNQISNKHKK